MAIEINRKESSLFSSLTFWIFVSMLAGIATGYFWPSIGSELKILNDVFLRLIKMIIAPLVMGTLILGVAKMGDFSSVGRIGIKTLAYFFFATILALLLGLILVNLTEPGKVLSMELPPSGAKTGIQNKKFELSEFVLHLIPTSIFQALANNDILPIVVFSVLFGTALASLGSYNQPFINTVEIFSKVIFKMTQYVMYAAPLGVFGAMAMVVGKYGLSVFQGYLYLIGVFYVGLLFFILFILGGICLVAKIPFFKLLLAVKEASIIAFSTASSESAYPQLMTALEKFGCSSRVTGFVIPLGYSFNLDGSIMYMTFATMFIAQAYGINLSMADQISMMLILMVTSKGMAGVPRASMVVIAAMLQHFSIPTEGLLLLLGIDQILDMGRSAVNIVGNAVAASVVSKWENEFNISR